MGKDYRVRWGWALAFGGLWLLQGAARADDQDLRKKVIELNLVTGNDPMVGRIKLLAADPEGTKKLIQAALKEKNELQFNGALILAQVAGDLKDLKSAEAFYRLCMKDGAKLQSTRKLLQSYGGLISLFYDNKKYPESARVCQELLELKTDDGKPRLVMIPVFNPRTGD